MKHTKELKIGVFVVIVSVASFFRYVKNLVIVVPLAVMALPRVTSPLI